jgi:3-methyladenine DNA glycosylase/8-oxoguanine DNA glycosylase
MMQIESNAPHDFYLTLDARDYFEAEYDPMEVYRRGLAVPLRLSERDILAVMHWNEAPAEPVFEVEFPVTPGPETSAEDEEVRRALRRVVGADIDLEAFYEQVSDDEVLGPLVEEYWGFKRMSRADMYEDAVRSIIHTRISHGPTQKRMVKDVREAYGRAFEYEKTTYYTYPRPDVLATIEPETFRDYGVSKRKGEYITGMAAEIVEGELDLEALEEMSAESLYERLQEIRGIGPATAQSLMLRRNRPDAYFPSHKTKGTEKGVRRWILQRYGMDPHETPEDEWQALRDRWRGWEALVSQYLYFDWVMERES